MKLVDLFSKKSHIQNINIIIEKLKEDNYYHENIENFNNKIEEFLKEYKVEEVDDFIQYSYLHFINLCLYQKKDKKGRNDNTLNEFFNVCTRIIELYIFIENKKLYTLKEKFFKIENYADCLYKHFRNISSKISNKDICIEFLKKNKDKRVFLNDNYFRMSSMPIIFSNVDSADTHFKQIFKLKNSVIKAVFNATLAKNIEQHENKKGNLSKRSDISTHIFTNESEYSNKSIAKNSSIEDVLDFHNLNKQKKSAYFKNYNITSKDIKKYNTNSKYKQHLIEKAISTQLTKNSMFLKSSYQFPNIEHLKLFVNKLIQERTNHSILILSSLFSGIKIKDLIYIFLNIHPKITYLSNQRIIRAEIPNDIFALKRTQAVEIHLNDEIASFFNIAYNYFKQQKSELTNNIVDEFVEKEIKNVSSEFNSNLKKLSKTVKFTLNNLDKCLRFYYHQFNENSDTTILFHINSNQSDKAKVCYVKQPSRLINLEFWIYKFYLVLTNKNINLKTVEDMKEIGSPFYINSADFKSFICRIDNLYQKNKSNNTIAFNLKMIFIRYSLSLLLATRDFKNSCDLKNYSKRLNFLTVHEKAKNIKTSKRLIPICSLAKDLIYSFYKIKDNTIGYTSYSPKLFLDNKFKDITQKTVENYLKNICTKDEQNEILEFITKCKLNFGRHVFSTLMRKEKINKDYENEFLGHFYLGNTALGEYSSFDNKDYHKRLVGFIDDKIMSEYFPSKISIIENESDCDE